MVKLGIICEGESEKIIFDSPDFKALMSRCQIELVDVVVAGSKTQYRADFLPKHRQILLDKGVERIIALVDLDDDQCITLTKQTVPSFDDQIVVVAVKEFENWYLADTVAMGTFTGSDQPVERPEEYIEPLDEIIRLYDKRFPKSKPKLANNMKRCGFTIERAEAHPNCPSARYFLNKLQTLASAN